MNVNKILERNRFTALCGGCGEIFHYSTIEEVIFAHQGGPNCETPCSSCANGVLCACEYCQSIITDKLNDLSRQSAEIDQMFIKLENAVAPVQDVPTPSVLPRPPVPEYFVSRVICPENFLPTLNFVEFSELLRLVDNSDVHGLFLSVVQNIANIRGSCEGLFIPFSELTVHQIVSAIYAAADEQSK